MMSANEEGTVAGLQNGGQAVPVVAFYSAQGGVGKSTLACKFAELVTIAPGAGGKRPNVLLVDFDIGAGGLTSRLTEGSFRARTVHEVLESRNLANARAIDVRDKVKLSSGGNEDGRGSLFLMPASRDEHRNIFDVIARIDPAELLPLLRDLIRGLVAEHDISCVVLDCAPDANPVTAAAAALSDVPLYIGRNEENSYKKARVVPDRFREWYPEFAPTSQRVIINAVMSADLFKARSEHYGVLDFVPFVDDVILEVEGLRRVGSFRMLLFEKWVVDIIRQVFKGRAHLVPVLKDVVGMEWVDALSNLNRCEEAPSMRRLRTVGFLRWVGIGLALFGAAAIGAGRLLDDPPDALASVGTIGVVVGLAALAAGWIAQSKRQAMLAAAKDLVLGGADEILRGLQEGPGRRKELDHLKKLADSVPATDERGRANAKSRR